MTYTVLPDLKLNNRTIKNTKFSSETDKKNYAGDIVCEILTPLIITFNFCFVPQWNMTLFHADTYTIQFTQNCCPNVEISLLEYVLALVVMKKEKKAKKIRHIKNLLAKHNVGRNYMCKKIYSTVVVVQTLFSSPILIH